MQNTTKGSSSSYRKASREEAMAIKAEVDYQRLVSINIKNLVAFQLNPQCCLFRTIIV